MDIDIDDPAAYATFLTAFRAADRANAGAGTETEVTYTSGAKTATYYFKAPNFECVAYKIGNATKIILTKYNHVSDVGSCSVESFRTALLHGAGSSPIVDKNMSTVIALMSEAARSKVVENAILAAMNYTKDFDFDAHELLFKNYGSTAEKKGTWTNGTYVAGWAPLTKGDYRNAFTAADGAGSDKVTQLNLL